MSPRSPSATPRANTRYLKGSALVVLVLQNSALALVMRHTRKSGSDSLYITTTAVLMAELLKLVVALVMQFKADGSIGTLKERIVTSTWGSPKEYLAMGIVALLYSFQNNLAYVATSHLDGPTYQIICQSKTLITALLSVAVLGRSLAWTQWLALATLSLGVGMVQLSGSSNGDKASQNSLLGFFSAFLLCFFSGLAGVYFELVLKGSGSSLWIKNIQLGSYGIMMNLMILLYKDRNELIDRGFFAGYEPMVWLCIFLNSLGGLAVAMVVKYADNLAKCFATSIAIVLSCVISIRFFGMELSNGFICGTLLVLGATYVYNVPTTRVADLVAYHVLRDEKELDGDKEPKDTV